MKKIIIMFLCVAAAVSAAAQNYRFGLVKDQGGETNIRKGPGTSYPVVETAPDGSFINFRHLGNGWAEVYTCYTDGSEQDFVGYMASSKIVVPPRSGVTKYVGFVKDEGGYTNIRKGPGTNYAVVGKVKDGSFILYHTDFNGSWYQVYTQQGKLRGYISASKVDQLESPEF